MARSVALVSEESAATLGLRPLTARSVLASALLGEDPPELPVSHLVALAGLFGVSPNGARVALSRMVGAGEAATDGDGRYRLAGHLLERRRRQEASLRAEGGPWDGTWHLVVVAAPASPPAHRSARRARLAAARLAEHRPGLWLRPANLALPEDVVGDPELVRWSAVPDADPVALAATLWDEDGWATRARLLLAALEDRPTDGPEDLAPGFALSAAVLRHLQADPLLPGPLVGPGWPGDALRAAYAVWDARYRAVLRTWGRTVACT